MTRLNQSAIAIAFALSHAPQLLADEVKHKQAQPAAEQVARADETMMKMDKAMEKDAPVSFQKSEYNDFMTNVAWMNRNGFVVGAPAWKGGEDGLHCH
jgi:hypothetical protein